MSTVFCFGFFFPFSFTLKNEQKAVTAHQKA